MAIAAYSHGGKAMTKDIEQVRAPRIPEYWTSEDIDERPEPESSALYRFVQNNEPAGRKDEKLFRDGLQAVVDEVWQAALASQPVGDDVAPTGEGLSPVERGYVGYLIYAWGETDKPIAGVVYSRAEVRASIIDLWLGDSEDEQLLGIMQQFDNHDWNEEVKLVWYFAIGGFSIEQAHGLIAQPSLPQESQPAQDTAYWASWTQRGIADFVADNWIDRKYALAEIGAGIRAIEIRPPATVRPDSTVEAQDSERLREVTQLKTKILEAAGVYADSNRQWAGPDSLKWIIFTDLVDRLAALTGAAK